MSTRSFAAGGRAPRARVVVAARSACAAAVLAAAALGAIASARAQDPAAAVAAERRADVLPARLSDQAPFGLPAALGERLAADPEPLVELGRALFFDPLLSADRSVSCASCHDPAHGFSDASARSQGVHGRTTERHAPSLFNRALGTSFMWDGRAATLEEQVLLPIENELEMGLALKDAIERLRGDSAYAARFEAALGAPADQDGLARALSSFVRRITLGDSPYDRFIAGEFDALTSEERGGLWIFESRGGCWRCHPPPFFTDEGFHATGIGARDGALEPGRMVVTGAESDRGRFKTPGLRGLALSAPYMHDGSVATLEGVVEHYRRGGAARGAVAGLDEAMQPFELSASEAASLVAFLRALSRAGE